MKKVKYIVFSMLIAFALCIPFLALKTEKTSYAEEDTQKEFTIESVEDWETVSNDWDTYSDYTLNLGNNLNFAGANSLLPLGNEEKPFLGNFNGNGFTISNFNLITPNEQESSVGIQNLGLFGYARNATIKNLKISGNISISYKEKNNNNLSLLLGYGDKVSIENIEIDAKIVNNGEVTDYRYTFNYNTNLGVVAGSLENSSSIKNILNKTSIKFDISQATSNNYYVGGIVGSLKNSTTLFAINYGNIDFTRTATANGTLSVGGIVGATSQIKSEVINNLFDARINYENITSSLTTKVGGVSGSVSSSTKGYVSYNYFTQNILPLGDNGYVYDNSNTHDYNQYINQNTNQKAFYENTNRWNSSKEAWDFNNKWQIITVSEVNQVALQMFRDFVFTANPVMDTENNVLVIEETKQFDSSYKWNKTASIQVNFRENLSDFYSISSLIYNDIEIANIIVTTGKDDAIEYLLNFNNAYKIFQNYIRLTHDSDIDSIKLDILVNNTTAGKYSFRTSANLFNNVVKADQDTTNGAYMGIVKRASSTADGVIKLDEKMIYGTIYSYIASATGTYTFDRWALYDATGTEIEINSTLDNTSNNTTKITFKFGEGNFTGNFSLVAQYSNDPYFIKIKFDKNGIEKLTIDDVEVKSNESYAVSKQASPIVKIYVKENYEFDFDGFLAEFKKTYYQDQDKVPTKRPATNDTNDSSLTVYSFSFKVSYLVANEDETLIFEIETKENKMNDNKIIIFAAAGGGALLLIIIIIVIVVVKKKKSGGRKGGGKSKKSSSSYKGLYG